MSEIEMAESPNCREHDHEKPCPFCINEKDDEDRIKRVAELEIQLTQARAEIVRLSNQTNYCLQCESYAKDRDRLKAENERVRGSLDLLVHLNRGINKGGEHPAQSDWEEAWTEADEALREGEGR